MLELSVPPEEEAAPSGGVVGVIVRAVVAHGGHHALAERLRELILGVVLVLGIFGDEVAILDGPRDARAPTPARGRLEAADVREDRPGRRDLREVEVVVDGREIDGPGAPGRRGEHAQIVAHEHDVAAHEHVERQRREVIGDRAERPLGGVPGHLRETAAPRVVRRRAAP